MTKRCPRCCLVLDESEFNWKVTGKYLAAYCKKCSREYIKSHYDRHVEYYVAKAKRSNQRHREKLFKYVGLFLQMHSCVDCGEKDILVLEFDHRDRSEKFGDISQMMSRMQSLSKLKKEISKCEIRCANCHRRKTARENHGWKLHFAPVV